MHSPRSIQRLRGVIRLTVAVVALACVCGTAFAGVEHPRDAAAVNSVHLDMALVQKLAAATEDLKNVPESVREQMEDVREMQKDDHGILRTPPVDVVVQELKRFPQFGAAVTKQGLSGRQYWLGMYALINGYIAAARVHGGDQATPANLEKWGVNPDHYRFCKAHFDEIRKLLPND